jgi:endo-1,4-beta-xylanase
MKTTLFHLRRPATFLLLAAISSPAPTLRQAADRAGILIGTAVRPSMLQQPAYAATISREFNMLEAEDVMKWWVVRRDPNTFDFTQAEELVRFAQAHNMKVRGHCLVWGRDNPAWLTHGNFTPAQLAHLLQEHIATVVKHFAGQVFAWDVVNEAFDEHGKVRDSLWYNQPGIGLAQIAPAQKDTAYIEQAFRWAHEADPHALLFITKRRAKDSTPSQTPSTPCSKTSNAAVFPSTGSACKCTSRIS